MTKELLVAVLRAYKEAVDVAAPGLHRDMSLRAPLWARESAKNLQTDLDRYLLEASRPSEPIRLFFKLGSALTFGGCNRQFAADAGFTRAEDMRGLDDFDPRVSWVAQAAKYRRDDREVMEGGRPKLGIIERQSSASGVTWLDTSKVPIFDGDRAVGIFGTYEIIDGKTATQRASSRNPPST